MIALVKGILQLCLLRRYVALKLLILLHDALVFTLKSLEELLLITQFFLSYVQFVSNLFNICVEHVYLLLLRF